MAKRRSAAQKRAFAKMIAGLRRHRRGKSKARRSAPRARRAPIRRRRALGRHTTARRVRFRNPMAVLANPSWVPALYGGDSSKRRSRKRRTRKGAGTMAKRKRRSGKRRARRASPRRRVHRRGRARRTTHRRRRAHARHRGGRIGVLYTNPRRRRRSRRGHARRRNPGIGGLARRVFVPYAAGFIASVGAAVLDSALSNYPMVRQLSKVGGAVAIAVFGRRHPVASAAAIGALAGSQGYALGTKLAGGMIAHTPAEAVKGLGEMQQTYPELGALLNGGVGALLSGPDDIDEVARNYTSALDNMSDGDDY